MKFNFTYKQLNLLAPLLAVFLLLLMYRQNISPTLALYSECNTMEEQLQKAQQAETRLHRLKAEFRKLDQLAGNSKLSNEEIRQAILTNTNLFSENANVSSIKEQHVFATDNMKVVTHMLELQGDYKELVKITHKFETSFKDARISTLKIFSTQDNRTKKINLYATYYFQNFKKQ